MAKGVYVPKQPEKYVGDVTKIVWRSTWELRVMTWFDSNPNILQWGSEEIAIPYVKPTDNRVHRYYPDFWAVVKQADGSLKKFIIEIKPFKESVLTKKSSTYDKINIVINEAKWNAAKQFCAKYGAEFMVLTEKQLFKGKSKK